MPPEKDRATAADNVHRGKFDEVPPAVCQMCVATACAQTDKTDRHTHHRNIPLSHGSRT